MADPTDGVLCLDQNLEIVRTFPGLIPSGTFGANQYRAAECAVTATIDTQELMFIACGTQHAVQILDYQTGVLQYTIGTPGTPGLPSNFVVGLATPVSLAVDETNNRLFIACQTGDPGEISLEIGFVVEFDITNPGAPVFVQYVLQGKGMFRLNNLECRSPSDVFYVPSPGGVGAPPDRLFISNGLGDIAAFERPSLVAPFRPGLIIEAIGQDYVLGPDTVAVPVGNFAQNALDVLLGSDGVAHLSVAVSNTGTIERFRVSSGQDIPFGAHEGKMGSHQVDDAGDYGAPLRSYPVARPITYATFESATGVCADEVILPGQLTATPCLVATDAQGGKVQRLALPLYEGNHTVTFQPEVSPVSFRVGGWFLPSDAQFPAETLVVEVRDPGLAATLTTPAILPTDWREVPRASSACGVGDPLTRYQFRIRAVLDPTAPVRQYQTSAIGVILHQEW
jgi:hypothetical protein